MGLQIRLTHSLGDRLIELGAQPADAPVVVGRAADAPVQVPSANIAKQHCLLFVAENRWVVQDAGSPSGTYLNGEPVDEPAFLNSGDVITLGTSANPPTILVDPHGLGVIEAAEEAAPAPAVYAAPPQPGLPQPVARGGVTYAPQYAAPPQPMAPSGGIVDDEEDDNIFAAPAAAGFSQPAYAPAAPPAAQGGTGWENAPRDSRYYVPKPKRTNATTAGVVIGVASVLALGLGIWIYKTAQAKEEASKPKVIKVEKDSGTPRKGTSIFDERTFDKPKPKNTANTPGGSSQTTPTPPIRTASSDMGNTARPTPPPVETEEKIDPRKQDEKWQEVELARTKDPVAAIVAFHSYLESTPDTPFKKDLDQYMDEAVDRIWWNRIDELFKDRDQYQQEIATRKNDLAISQDAEFKKTLQAEITRLEEKRTRAEERLKEQMKFEGKDRPDIYSDAQLAKLRTQRDAEFYAQWKQQVVTSIQKRRTVPWSQNR